MIYGVSQSHRNIQSGTERVTYISLIHIHHRSPTKAQEICTFSVTEPEVLHFLFYFYALFSVICQSQVDFQCTNIYLAIHHRPLNRNQTNFLIFFLHNMKLCHLFYFYPLDLLGFLEPCRCGTEEIHISNPQLLIKHSTESN